MLLSPLPDGLEERLKTMLARGEKIDALKELRRATGLGFKEAKDVIDLLKCSSLHEKLNPADSAID
jgi:ribosomal protein L7/L12